MSLVVLSLANNAFDHITLTNSLAVLMNNLTDPTGVFQSNGVIMLSGNGTTLIVNNAATFGTVNATTIQVTTLIANTSNVRGVEVLTHANNAYAAANLVYTFANSAYLQANTANNANGYGYIWANSAYSKTNAAFTQANTANSTSGLGYLHASDAYANANVRVAQTGDTMTGKLTLPASNVTTAGFSIGQGVAPASPANGDMWVTPGGVYIQYAGATKGPLATLSGHTEARLLFLVG